MKASMTVLLKNEQAICGKPNVVDDFEVGKQVEIQP
jgi:hypothetical protein